MFEAMSRDAAAAGLLRQAGLWQDATFLTLRLSRLLVPICIQRSKLLAGALGVKSLGSQMGVMLMATHALWGGNITASPPCVPSALADKILETVTNATICSCANAELACNGALKWPWESYPVGAFIYLGLLDEALLKVSVAQVLCTCEELAEAATVLESGTRHAASLQRGCKQVAAAVFRLGGMATTVMPLLAVSP